MSVAVLKQFLRYGHQRSAHTVASDITDINKQGINVVHVRRRKALTSQQYRPLIDALQQHGPVKAILATEPSQAAVQLAQLLGPRAQGTAAQAAGHVQHDILEASQQLREELGWEAANLRLEAVTRVTCPRWHADHVGFRLLVTYSGPGTQYVSDDHAHRRWDVWGGNVLVAGADEGAALQAGPGDWLLLKGHLAPGNYGLGTVHRSPELEEGGAPRLLLTMDDDMEAGCACGC